MTMEYNNKALAEKISKVRDILKYYLKFGLMMERTPPENRLDELDKLLNEISLDGFPDRERDMMEIIYVRLQHRFGNPEAGCVDMENADSLDKQLPEMIDILKDIREEFE